MRQPIKVGDISAMRAQGRCIVVEPLHVLLAQQDFGMPVIYLGVLDSRPGCARVVIEWPRGIVSRGRECAEEIPEPEGQW